MGSPSRWLAAAVLPFRKPELFRSSVSTARIAGIPVVVVVAGVAALLGVGVLYYLYFKYEYFGLADQGSFFLWLGGTVLVGLLAYATAFFVKRQQGIDLNEVYREIPPE